MRDINVRTLLKNKINEVFENHEVALAILENNKQAVKRVLRGAHANQNHGGGQSADRHPFLRTSL